MMIRAIIVENEKPHSDYLAQMIKDNFPEIHIQAICSSVNEAIEKINEFHPKLVFIDVQLKFKQSGFEVLEQTRHLNYGVIFTTSYSEYALKAIEFCALHYLLKPYGHEKLKEAIDRYKTSAEKGTRENIDALLLNIKQTVNKWLKVGIPIMGGLEFINVSEIIRCQSANNYTNFYLTGKRIKTATKTLKWADGLLREHNFFRVHDSHLVNLSHIIRYTRGGEGGVIELSEGHEVDVSRRRKDEFLKVLGELKMISVK